MVVDVGWYCGEDWQWTEGSPNVGRLGLRKLKLSEGAQDVTKAGNPGNACSLPYLSLCVRSLTKELVLIELVCPPIHLVY